jgi:A/G-specific adenine glycosylase
MAFQQKLIDWFAKNRRPLPWRKRYGPYDVWVSEIMLQQTQMDTALPYFERWMKALPNVKTLAAAEPQKVLKLWEGLGYYSRARNIHESAKRIVAEHGGKFPDDFETILSLKGVGRYTAGAIASIAFNQKKPIVDGNVLRVLSRIYAIGTPADSLKEREGFWKLQESLIPENARDFNQGLMELGALICTPQNPACALCPVKAHCKAYKEGDPEKYPVLSPRKKIVKVEAAALALKKDGKYLLRLRPVGAVMGGLWEFPEWKLSYGRAPVDVLRIASGKIKKEFGAKLQLEPIGTIKRNYTNHLESLHVFTAEVSSELKPKTGWEHVWTKNFSDHPFSSAHSKIAKLLK